MEVGSYTGRTILLDLNGCLSDVRVNERRLNQTFLPWCAESDPLELFLGDYLHSGLNTLTAQLYARDGVVRFDLMASPRDRYIALYRASLALVSALLLFLLLMRFKALGSCKDLVAALSLGLGFRILYGYSTSFWQRGHDWAEHLAYINYVAQHCSIPKANGGYEFYHPPLYYFIGAGIKTLGLWAGLSEPTAQLMIQYFALASSMVAVLASLWVLAQQRSQCCARFVTALLLASIPAPILISARISNDVLQLPLAALALAFMLHWWRTGRNISLLVASMCVALGVLTKLNTASIIVVLFVCLLCRAKQSLRQKFALTASLAVFLFACIGPYLYMRQNENSGRSLLGSYIVDGKPSMLIGDVLKLENSWRSYLTFNPLEMIKVPYNDPYADSARRQYFWEYLFRSVFFGEFNFGDEILPVAKVIVALGCVTVIMVLIGLVASCGKELYLHLPLHLTLGVTLAALLYFRMRSPFSPHQDFRLVSVLTMPAAVYLMRGMNFKSNKLNCTLATVALFLAGYLGVFYVMVYLYASN